MTENERLSNILTNWSMVINAHQSNSKMPEARSELLLKYHKPIFKYVIGILRKNGVHHSQLEDQASDFCNQFAIKFLEGAFHGASAERGKFRVYIKTAIRNDIWRFIKSSHEKPMSLPDQIAASDDVDTEFSCDWREQLVSQAWQKLSEVNARYHDILKLRMYSPEMTAHEIAGEYESNGNEKLSKENVRKILEKARKKLATLMVDEVARSIENPNQKTIKAELRALDLLGYCSTVMDRCDQKKEP